MKHKQIGGLPRNELTQGRLPYYTVQMLALGEGLGT